MKQIERDLPRTQPDHPAFQTPKLKDMMKEVLVAYAQLDSEVGYVQGMNFVAAVLVYHSRTSYEALNVFTYIMKLCGYRKLFLGDLSYSRKLAGRLTQDLRRLVYDLYVHLVFVPLSRLRKGSTFNFLPPAGISPCVEVLFLLTLCTSSSINS